MRLGVRPSSDLDAYACDVQTLRAASTVVATDKGCKVITHFPAEDLPIANAY